MGDQKEIIITKCVTKKPDFLNDLGLEDLLYVLKKGWNIPKN